MVQCKNCKNRLTKDDEFCTGCGTKVEELNSVKKVKPSGQSLEEVKDNSLSKSFIGIAGIMVLFILMLFVFFLFITAIVVCDQPYIQVGKTCCLDVNDNKICDEHEGNIKNNIPTDVKNSENEVAVQAKQINPLNVEQ